MKQLLTSIVAALAVTTSAQAADWSGAYVGAGLSLNNGTAYDSSYGNGPVDTDGAEALLFTGYNWQFNRLIYSGEFWLGLGGPSGDDGDFLRPVTQESSYGVKARLGYDMDRFMPFVSLGYANLSYSADHDGGGSNIANDSFGATTLGVGADYALSRNTILRIEAEHLNIEGTAFDFGGSDLHGAEFSRNRLNLSVAWKF